MATDRYATNQFYKLNSFEPFVAGTEQLVGQEDNPPFIYPPKTLRNAPTGTSTNVQRGYIRMMTELIDPAQKNLAKRRLHFQFNPDTITRSVSARNDIQLWMNMDPAQMAQPIPGDANFAFELLFNREAEVTSGKYVTGVPYGAAGSRTFNSSNVPATLPFENSGVLAQSSVTDIGVLADLIVFDELIGQGINKSLLEAMVNRAQVGSEYKAAQDAESNKDSTKDTEDQAPKPASFNASDVRTVLENNWGNSAFLVSQPIRVVFSSLFIVEGYVTNTTVTFNKFTPTMVPTQAVVGLQMQAMYMGFGKKETFFTKTFQSNEEKYAETVQKKRTEESALELLGNAVFAEVDKNTSGTGDDANNYETGPSGVLDTNGENTDKAWIRFKGTSKLKEAIKERNSIAKVTVSATLTMTYKGNSSSIPSGVTDEVGDVVYSETITADLSTKELSNDTPWSRAEWGFPKYKGYENVIHDKSSTSKYEMELEVTTTLEGNNGGSVTCKQVGKMKKTVAWSDNVWLAKELTFHVETITPERRATGRTTAGAI